MDQASENFKDGMHKMGENTANKMNEMQEMGEDVAERMQDWWYQDD